MTRLPVALPLVALVLLCVFLLQGCATPQAPQEAPQEARPRTLQASYSEPVCQSVAAFGLISAIGLPGYLIASGFANRACVEAAK
jgi:hypothetical protein